MTLVAATDISDELPKTELLANLPIIRLKRRDSLPSRGRIVSPPPRLRIDTGRMLGNYLLEERIGQGGSGAVFRAHHPTLKVPVAIKVLHAGDPATRRQLATEARILARLDHPNVVRVWDYEDAVPRPFLVLEYVDGPDLAVALKRQGPLAVDVALRIVTQIAGALAAGLRLGIVHRDVKPANLLLAAGGSAKLADLGLATFVHRGANPGGGTPAYMAPEQSAGASADHRADIYALGATLYHLICGHVPFAAASRPEMIRRHLIDPLTFPVEMPPDVAAVIRRMMAKTPAERFASYEELQRDFTQLT